MGDNWEIMHISPKGVFLSLLALLALLVSTGPVALSCEKQEAITMIRTMLDKLYSHGSEEDKETAVNILSVSLTDLQYAELMRLEAEIDDYIAELKEPPDEEEIKLKYPAMCDGCEE